jgi:hypothetical protein
MLPGVKVGSGQDLSRGANLVPAIVRKAHEMQTQLVSGTKIDGLSEDERVSLFALDFENLKLSFAQTADGRVALVLE